MTRTQLAQELDAQTREDTEVRLGHDTAFYGEFLEPEVPASSVDDGWGDDVNERAEQARVQALNTDEPEHVRRRKLRALRDDAEQVVTEHGDLIVSLVFTEAAPASGDSLQAHLYRGGANWLTRFGPVHAAICINNCVLLEWGDTEVSTASLVLPQEIDPVQLGVSLIVMRKSLRQEEASTDVNPCTLSDLCNRVCGTLRDVRRGGDKLRRCVEEDLRAISDVVCEWNRDKRYDMATCNCQHFALAILERLGIRIDLSAPMLTQYLRQIADGSLWRNQTEPEQGVLCFNWDDTRYAFATADELDAFIAAGKHTDLPKDAHYLLGSFHELFKTRADHYPNDPRWQRTGAAALPDGFDWDRFTDGAAARMGALMKRY